MALAHWPGMTWPGLLWYRLLFGLAGRLRHPRAAVHLRESRRALRLHYHALGGDPGCDVAAGAGVRGTLMGDAAYGGQDLLAWLDHDRMHLPARINRFPDRALNRELYFWLAAWFALDRAPRIDPDGALNDGSDGKPDDEPSAGPEDRAPRDGRSHEEALSAGLRHLFRGLATSARVLERFPALSSRYERLCAAELAQRQDALPALGDHATQPAHRLEAAIRYALGAAKPPDDAWLVAVIDGARHGTCPAPPPRWRRLPVPFLPVFLWGASRPEGAGLRLRWLRRRARRRARGTRRSLARPRFEPDRRTDSTPGPRLGATFQEERLYPEWDHERRLYRPDWCRVTEPVADAVESTALDAEVFVLARRVRHQFEILREVRSWTRGLESGEDPDLEAFVDAFADRRGRGVSNPRLYRRRESRRRDLAVAVLLDASRSTAAWVGEHRAIEVARQSMVVLAEALTAAGDEFALYGFASDSRLRVRCHRLKGFDERYDDDARRRLAALGPRDYTRMGAAIRHVGARLRECVRTRKLMLVLTDGRPHDPTDGYEGRHALEDTRRALRELRVHGVHCFGLTIDRHGRAWLPFLFGPGHYAVFSRPEALPAVLPRLYARITESGG